MTRWNQFGEVISDDRDSVNIDASNAKDYDWSKDTYGMEVVNGGNVE